MSALTAFGGLGIWKIKHVLQTALQWLSGLSKSHYFPSNLCIRDLGRLSSIKAKTLALASRSRVSAISALFSALLDELRIGSHHDEVSCWLSVWLRSSPKQAVVVSLNLTETLQTCGLCLKIYVKLRTNKKLNSGESAWLKRMPYIPNIRLIWVQTGYKSL